MKSRGTETQGRVSDRIGVRVGAKSTTMHWVGCVAEVACENWKPGKRAGRRLRTTAKASPWLGQH